VKEAAVALTITAASVAGALLIGGLVWYGLNWARGGSAEPPHSLAIAPESPATPAPPTSRAPPQPAPATAPPAAAPAPGPMGPGEGIVAILGTPGAQISVDGRPAGRSPREIRLSPGTHRIRASHPELGTAEETIEVVAGKRTLWNTALSK
jgi:hypothetical protein